MFVFNLNWFRKWIFVIFSWGSIFLYTSCFFISDYEFRNFNIEFTLSRRFCVLQHLTTRRTVSSANFNDRMKLRFYCFRCESNAKRKQKWKWATATATGTPKCKNTKIQKYWIKVEKYENAEEKQKQQNAKMYRKIKHNIERYEKYIELDRQHIHRHTQPYIHTHTYSHTHADAYALAIVVWISFHWVEKAWKI